MEEVLLGVMNLQEAKNHQIRLKEQGIIIHLKSNEKTCTTGCKVTVEVWGLEKDSEQLMKYFRDDYMKHVMGHEPNVEYLSQVFDANASETICQACGANFATTLSECPDCGLCYG